MTQFTVTQEQLDSLWAAADESRKSSREIKVPREAFVALLLHYQRRTGAGPMFEAAPRKLRQGVLL